MQQDILSTFNQNLKDMQDLVFNAKKVPLMNNLCVVDREQLVKIMDSVLEALPDAFAECETVVQNQISIISEANEMAENTKQEALGKANEMVSEAQQQASQMVAQAQQQANDMLQKAQQQANGMVRDAQEIGRAHV